MGKLDPRLENIFAQALEIADVKERAAFVESACGGDETLRREVEAMLGADQGAGNFMQATLVVGPANIIPSEEAGDRIGRYKLLEQIGEGGFGVVWMAEQEEPVRRRVALKIIKLGMDTRQVLARFEAERQALAMMEHPNIAKVFDGGATDTGRPYFVMELVKGIPITAYCDANKLSTFERLALFIQVCQAVQHAHQKGIIHRDLKPSNILVTEQDGAPVPKVIDFGVAKATQARLTEKTLFTGLHQMIGTPAYMSPEQAGLGALDIDTRSDIYALGTLLYELLTGRTPFTKEEFEKASLDEIFRLIREQDPPKPSTRISTLTHEELTTISTRRHSEPAKLNRLVRGDLDWIVMKCLEKNRQRRYETPDALAQDVARHLSNEPVLASSPSVPYLVGKFMRRHKAGLAVAAALLLFLLAGAAVSTWQAVRATRAERTQSLLRQEAEQARANEARLRQQAETNQKTAEAAASKSRQVAQFLQDMLQGVGPSVALGRDTTMLREILEKTAERTGKDLADQPEVQAQLETTIGLVYRELGQYARSESMFRSALATRSRLFGSEHVEVGASLNDLAYALWLQGKVAEGGPLARESLRIRRNLLGQEHPAVADSLDTLALLACTSGQPEEGEKFLRETLAMNRKLFGNEHPRVATALDRLATALTWQGRLAEAEQLQRQRLAICRRLHGEVHPDVAVALADLASSLGGIGKVAEAETLNREALAMCRTLSGPDHPDVAAMLCNLGELIRAQGRFVEADALHREALAIRIKAFGPEHRIVALSLKALGLTLRDQGKSSEAADFMIRALDLNRKLFGREALGIQMSPEALARELATVQYGDKDAVAVGESLDGLALVLRDQGRFLDAEEIHHQTLALYDGALGHSHPAIAAALGSLGLVLRAEGRLSESEAAFRKQLAMLQSMFGSEYPQVPDCLNHLGQVLCEQTKFGEAEALTRGRLEHRDKALPDDWRTSYTRTLLGMSLLGQQKYHEAEKFLISAQEGLRQFQERIPASEKWVFSQAEEYLVALYRAAARPDKVSEWVSHLKAEFPEPLRQKTHSSDNLRPTMMNAAPSMAIQPASQGLAEGQTAALSVLVLGSPPLFYQWHKDDRILTGETNFALLLPNLVATDAGSYRVSATNQFGAVTSSIAALTIRQVREVPFVEVNFEEREPSAGYSAFTYSEKPAALSSQIAILPGWGAGGSAGLVMKADGSVFTNGPSQGWAGFGATITAFAGSTNGVNTTNLSLYKLDVTIRTTGLVRTNSHGRIQWQFLTPDGVILSRDFRATFTTNYQGYSLVVGEGAVDPGSEVSWSRFAAGFDRINRVQCVVTVDDWLREYGLDADDTLCIDDLRFVRLVPSSSPKVFEGNPVRISHE